MPEPPALPSVSPAAAARATVALILLRIAYAYNWFDIGPGFPALSATFDLGLL